MSALNSLEKSSPLSETNAQEGMENRREQAERPTTDGDRDEARLAAIDQGYSRTTALERLAGMAGQSENHNQADIAKIREDLGLSPLDNPPVTAAGLSSEVLKVQAEKENRDLAKKEQEYLGVPEFGAGLPSEPDAEPGSEFNGVEEESPEEQEEAIKKRQTSIDAWIAGGVNHMVERFGETLKSSQNGDQAEKLLTLKVLKGAAKLAEDYVKTGKGKQELAFVISIKTVNVANAETGGTDQFISDIAMDGGPGIRDRFPDLFKKKEGEALDAEQANKIEKAKEAGEATEEEVK